MVFKFMGVWMLASSLARKWRLLMLPDRHWIGISSMMMRIVQQHPASQTKSVSCDIKYYEWHLETLFVNKLSYVHAIFKYMLQDCHEFEAGSNVNRQNEHIDIRAIMSLSKLVTSRNKKSKYITDECYFILSLKILTADWHMYSKKLYTITDTLMLCSCWKNIMKLVIMRSLWFFGTTLIATSFGIWSKC